MQTLNLGHNESVSRGIVANADNTFTAMIFTQSKDFKTILGAEKWLAKRGLKADGTPA